MSCKKRKAFHFHAGYTLVELSIVIIIVSLLTAAGLAAGASMVERAAYIDTRKLLNQLQQSLKDYYVVNAHLPCVARMDVLPGSEEFGQQIENCEGTPPLTGGTWEIDDVRIGAIPTRTLGLPDSAAADKFGNRFVYAVSKSLTSVGTFSSGTGNITVRNMDGHDILDGAAFFIASPGRDRKGAYTYQTAQLIGDCSGSTSLDADNCDFTNAIFRDAPFNNGDVTERFFDDMTVWAPKFHLSSLTATSDALWAAKGDSFLYSVGLDEDSGNTNVGIGTDEPRQKLDIRGGISLGASDTYYMTITGSGSDLNLQSQSTLAGLNIKNKDNEQKFDLSAMTNYTKLEGSTESGELWLSNTYTKLTGPGGIGGIAIDEEGWVGIGGGADVREEVYLWNKRFSTGGKSTNGLVITYNGHSSKKTWIDAFLLTSTAHGTLRFQGGSSSSMEDIMVFRSRNVGIGRDDPSYKLDVNGSLRATSVTQSSDARMKTHIRDVSHGLDAVAALRPVSFDWKAPLEGQSDLGFLAQDVKQVLPELVSAGNDGYMSLSYNGLSAVMVKAIQELQAQNARLQAQVEALEQRRDASGPASVLLPYIMLLCAAGIIGAALIFRKR